MKFDTLYKTYESRLRGHAMNLTKNQDYAKDLFQETMLRVWKNWSIFNHHSEPETRSWLFRIMNNLNINAYRRGLKIDFKSISLGVTKGIGCPVSAGYISTQDYMTSDLVTKETPEKILKSQQIGSKIFSIISNLPDKFRAVSTLCFIENRSYNEISEILNIPGGTVRSRVCRSRRLIQSLYSGEKRNEFVYCSKSDVYHSVRVTSARKVYAQCGFVKSNKDVKLTHKPLLGRSLCKNCERKIKNVMAHPERRRNE